MARLPLVIVVLFLVIVACRSSSSARHKIGLIPWGNVTKEVMEAALSDSFTVITVPTEVANSPYERMEQIYSFLESQNLRGLVGPYEREAGLVAESQRLPYLSVTDVTSEARDYTLELSPNMADIGMAAYDVAHFYSWSKISIFYDDDRGMTLLEKLMTNHTMTVLGWRLPRLAQDGQVKRCLVEMRKVQAETSVILCNRDNTRKILEQARQLVMLSTPPYQWIFYDPVLEATDLLLSFNIAINFTVLSHLHHTRLTTPRLGLSHLDDFYVTEAAALLTSAHRKISGGQNIDSVIRQAFDGEGHRKKFTLHLMGPNDDNQIEKIGEWHYHEGLSDSRLQMREGMSRLSRTTSFPLRDCTAHVVMIEDPPFMMKKKDFSSRKGNDRFEGFAVDLIKEVAEMLKFDYEIYLVHDGNFGSKQSDGQWNGMIGELLAGNATMSVAPLSINSDREEAVDFTKPFMTRHLSVLMRVPHRETSYLEFMTPVSPVVWICTLLAFIVVSLVLCVLEKICSHFFFSSPDANANVNPSPNTPREALWFMFGSVLAGNTDSAPITTAGRILSATWWFFAMVMIACYTANLAAFLTVKKINTPIRSVMDLAQQTHIKYGTVKSSGVVGFFKNTNNHYFGKMWNYMSEIEADSMVDNTSVAVAKVKEEDYAFIWDSTVIKYQAMKDCDLMEIGPHFSPKGFGIGVPPGAMYRENLTMAILELSDQARLQDLETKYWGNRNCPDLSKSLMEDSNELTLENMAGVFFIVVGGIILAAVVFLGSLVIGC
ncbi:glutamate receptor ionotropic, kainate 3-like [Babylonia areolata]|uniref:glutamate receptor ionotropic, kainate 3-like n=1 Tax=Babylonia areolata TaxID=304850 RepID=UPI003FD3A903